MSNLKSVYVHCCLPETEKFYDYTKEGTYYGICGAEVEPVWYLNDFGDKIKCYMMAYPLAFPNVLDQPIGDFQANILATIRDAKGTPLQEELCPHCLNHPDLPLLMLRQLEQEDK